MSHATGRRAAVLAGIAAAAAAVSPGRAIAAPPGATAVLELAASRLLLVPAEPRAPALAAAVLTLGVRPVGDDDGDAAPPLPAWLRNVFRRWDTYDGEGYGVGPAGDRDGWFVGGEYERVQGPQPLAIEPDEEPDSPRRRVAGDDARSVGAVVDLSEIPRLLVAIGAGGGRRHLHAYLGWQVTVQDGRRRR